MKNPKDLEELMKLLSGLEGNPDIEVQKVSLSDMMSKLKDHAMDSISPKQKAIANTISDKLGKEVMDCIMQREMSSNPKLQGQWTSAMAILCELFHNEKIILKSDLPAKPAEDGGETSDQSPQE